jgi:hypothetical protein
MASLFRPTYPDKKTGKIKRLKRWYAKYRDAAGKLCKAPLSTNKAADQLMLGELLVKVERERAGQVDRSAAHASTPLAVHVAAWAADLAAGEVTGKHVRQTTGYVAKVIDGTAAAFTADLTAERVRAYLADLRRDRPSPPLDQAKG